MEDEPDNADDDATPPNEGVRLIGADEAAQARERADVARRLGEGERRPGDRPDPAPGPPPGKKPTLSFPLSSSREPDAHLPDWTDPPTGQVPSVLRGSEPPETPDDEWSSFAAKPRWRDSGDDFDDLDDVGQLADDEDRMGALDDSDRPSESDFFSFDDLDEPPAGRSVFADDLGADADDGYEYDDPADEVFDDGTLVEPGPAPARRVVIGSGTQQPADVVAGIIPDSGGRNVPQAAAVGLAFGAVALICFAVGPAAALALVLVVVTLASLELFNAFQKAGYEPITLVGVAATAGMLLGAYHRGEGAIPAALFLTTVVCLLWYLVGAGTKRPTMNAGVTVLGVVWVGMFGSFAALMLSAPDGVGLLLGAILVTVGYDVGGFFVGKNAGRAPLSAASPNKTWEGLLGGMFVAFVVGVAIAGRFAPWSGSFADAAKLGLVAAIAAPVGDLCQSLVKRDLGIKDMGTILPGHGGLLDRFDALLFVLPSVYYLARASDFFL